MAKVAMRRQPRTYADVVDALAIQLTPRADVGHWTAWAASDAQRFEGHDDTAEDAMADLANRLRTVRANANGQ